MNLSTATANSITQPPWYRVGMVWLMISLPLIVVLASILTVIIAYQNAPDIISSMPK